jgi:2-keto-4-pentenoate hydratase/2-oxohepta-3-ene-1,7-dioic acid hydratase in catechol pathway
MSWRLIAAAVVAAALLVGGAAWGEEALTPTDTSVDFCGYSRGFHLKPGDVVSAYTPAGVLCGQCTVREADTYGFLHVYGDDPRTAQVEGALRGQTITIKVNGETVKCLGPDQPVWAGDGARVNTDLGK